MKNIIISILILSLGILSCTKDNNTNSGPIYALTASKTAAIKIGEPVVFSTPNILNGDVVNGAAIIWEITHAEFTKVENKGTTASISFFAAGTFIVSIRYGSVYLSQSVVVDNDFYDDDPNKVQGFYLTNEELDITVSNADIINSATGTLKFDIKAKNDYCTQSNLGIVVLTEDLAHIGDISLVPIVFQKPSCNGNVSEKLSTDTAIPDITNGKHNLSFKLNGTTYTGSFTREDNKYTFTWPYTIGVKLTYKP